MLMIAWHLSRLAYIPRLVSMKPINFTMCTLKENLFKLSCIVNLLTEDNASFMSP